MSGVALALISDAPADPVSVEVDSPSSDAVTADLGNATVTYIPSAGDDQASGTGLFDPFVRLQGSPTEEGYNTNGTIEFETKAGKWTKAILASAIPVVDCGGDLAGTDCWELFVDINEGNNAKHISLNEVEIWLTTDANITGYDGGFDAPAEKVYDFTGDILINDVNQGSGRGDLLYLVPVQPFDAGDFFVLYSEWGTTGTVGTTSYSSEGGFEEWKVRKAPNVTIVKTADPVGPVNAGATIGFDITISNTGAAAATNVVLTDQLPTAGGLNWSLVAPVTGCTLSATDLLSCTFATLASGASITIELTSPTTAAACGLVDNPAASFTADGGLSGSDGASVTVNCAAIKIVKNSTKLVSGNPVLVATEGATFSITGPGGYTNSVTDDNAAGVEDEDTTIGEVCISGLAPGTYTINETAAPTGYGGTTQTNVSAVAAVGTNCTTSQPTAANSATFSNAPLGEFIINFNDLGSGETSAKIDCTGITPTPADATPADHDDDTETYTNLPGGNPAIVYSCTISIDP